MHAYTPDAPPASPHPLLLDGSVVFDLDATHLDAAPLDATPLDASPFDATDLDATLVDATPLDATLVDATPLDATHHRHQSEHTSVSPLRLSRGEGGRGAGAGARVGQHRRGSLLPVDGLGGATSAARIL